MTTISTLPAAPDRTDPSTFSARSDAWVSHIADVFQPEINAVITEQNANTATTTANTAIASAAAATAATAASVASTSATTALTAPGTSATSTTSLTIGTGSKTLTIQTGKALVVGMYVTVAYTVTPANLMVGQITAYDSGTGSLTVNVTDTTGSGTFADWTVAISARPFSLPVQTGNAGKFLQTNGTIASWAAAGISNVVTATTATTLTSTPTLLQITPAAYGVTVTLPDATTCALGGPLHCIDNRGGYPVRVVNNSGTLLGFVPGGVVSNVWLDDNSTAAGTWAVENIELVGAAAQLISSTASAVVQVIALDADREFVLLDGSLSYGVIYNKATNAFGSVTLIRNAAVSSRQACIKTATDQVLVVSCTGTTGFEAVVLTISGTTITAGTAATATLSANISAFADGCGLIAVGSSWVTSYTVATPAAQIRALSISGTTVTIGSATVLDGTAGGLVAASGSVVIAVSTASTSIYTKPYTISGSTISAGTGTTTTSGSMTLRKFAALGTRWAVLYVDGTDLKGGIVSLSGTTTTISVATLFATGDIADAMVVGSTKVLVLNDQTSSNANILTDSAGTASAGTSVSFLSSGAGQSHRCLYANGSSVAITVTGTIGHVHYLDCSGASPVVSLSQVVNASTTTTIVMAGISPSNAVLSRSPTAIFGSNFAEVSPLTAATTSLMLRVSGAGIVSLRPKNTYGGFATSTASNLIRGPSDNIRWMVNGSVFLGKMECVA